MASEMLTVKQLHELEQKVQELLLMLKKMKMHHEPAVEALRQLEEKLAQARRERFDASNSEYN